MTLCSCLACYDGAPALLQYDWMARQKEEEEETAWGGGGSRGWEGERETVCIRSTAREALGQSSYRSCFACVARFSSFELAYLLVGLWWVENEREGRCTGGSEMEGEPCLVRWGRGKKAGRKEEERGSERRATRKRERLWGVITRCGLV